MAAYVGLTLVLAIVAVVSIFISSRLSREALAASDKQSREALAASDKQSKDAIEAIQKQIDASEKQTKDTIEAVNRQIEASERQAQEALYNQHKPVIVPLTRPLSTDAITFEVNTQNKGSGVALNAYGLLTLNGFPSIMCSNKVFFLVPDKEEDILFSSEYGKAVFPYNVFEGENVFSSEVRFLVTYNDAFGNKYLAVFDHSDEFGWRQIGGNQKNRAKA